MSIFVDFEKSLSDSCSISSKKEMIIPAIPFMPDFFIYFPIDLLINLNSSRVTFSRSIFKSPLISLEKFSTFFKISLLIELSMSSKLGIITHLVVNYILLAFFVN